MSKSKSKKSKTKQLTIRSIYPKKDKFIKVRVTEKQLSDFKAVCKDKGQTMSYVLLKAMYDYLGVDSE
jgi:hypothetical protein